MTLMLPEKHQDDGAALCAGKYWYPADFRIHPDQVVRKSAAKSRLDARQRTRRAGGRAHAELRVLPDDARQACVAESSAFAGRVEPEEMSSISGACAPRLTALPSSSLRARSALQSGR
ncbi:hypothetical protein CB1_001430008 [Camelus ferus]|nr:hypothetical protein CB1_001430008 [Camelus ferus]